MMTELLVNYYLYSSDFPVIHFSIMHFKGNITEKSRSGWVFSLVWTFEKKQMVNNNFHKYRSNAETNYKHNSAGLNPEWTRTQDSDMNKDWKWLEMLPQFSLRHTQRNVVPNRAAQGALMSASLGMLSFLFPPLYSSLSIPFSFFLLFSS